MNLNETLTLITDEITQVTKALDAAAAAAIVDAMAEAPRIFVAGAGRSGLCMRAFGMRLMHMGMTVHVVGDVTTPAIVPGDLLLIGSGSGATASLVAAADKAKEVGCTLALITTGVESPMADRADLVLRAPVSTPKAPTTQVVPSSQPMGALFEQTLWITLDALIMLLMAELGIDADSMFVRHANLE